MERWLKCDIGETQLHKRSVYYYTIFNITYSFHHCVHCSIVCLKKLRKQTTFHINMYFMIRTTYVVFQTSTIIYTTQKLYLWLWNKTAYMTMKRKSRLPKNWGSLCHTHNQNDSHNNIKWYTIILCVIIF